MIIVNLVQNFVGSNNINLFQFIGQFGIWFYGGKDVVSFCYIFIMLSILVRLFFFVVDDNFFKFFYDDN